MQRVRGLFFSQPDQGELKQRKTPFLPQIPLREPRASFSLDQYDQMRAHLLVGRIDLAVGLAHSNVSTIACMFALLTDPIRTAVKDRKTVSEYAEIAIRDLSGTVSGEGRAIFIDSLERLATSPFMERLGQADKARKEHLVAEVWALLDRLERTP
jgi:hypothetical protein